MDPVAAIAQAVLYEGYILWPYRRSALKNRHRWTFGGVYPEAYSRARGEDDPWHVQVQCLLETDAPARVMVRLRCLQVVDRQVLRRGAAGYEPVDELAVGGERHLSWEEATEREVVATIGGVTSCAVEVAVDAGGAEEPLRAPDGTTAGAVRRRWRALHGWLRIDTETIEPGLVRVTAELANDTPWTGGTRDAAQRQAFVSAHLVLGAEGGGFVSLTDPPANRQAAAAACRNFGLWPVLVGEEGGRHTLLAAPIILPDYPRIAPESPGDLFDGGEIDQLLILNVLSLSEEEQAEMRATDPRAREILERCAALTPDQLMRLHGAIREFRPVLREG